MDWMQHPDRRRGRQPFEGKERRAPAPYADEMPKDPTPGDPGAEARERDAIERGRESERKR